MRVLLLAPVLLLAGCSPAGGNPQQRAPQGVVSIDYCADQMLLKLVPRERVKGVSQEADVDQYFAAPRAAGLARVRPDIESILRLNPAIVVKSYGGGPTLDAALAKANIKVVQLGYAGTLADIRTQMLETAQALDVDAAGQKSVANFDKQLSAIVSPRTRPSLLYLTPGGVTTGMGSLIDDAIRAAGYRNYETRAGWRSLPIERLSRAKPDVVLAAFFDNKAHNQDAWSSARHPLVQSRLRGVPVVKVPGSAVSCGNWLIGDVIEQLAALRRAS